MGADPLFAGAGEMRSRCRAFDWAASPLGPVETWPVSLRTAAAIVLAAGFPTILVWGPELVQLYNDAYAPLIGARHPGALGMPTHACWPEIRHIQEPIFARVFAGETVTVEEALYPLARNGTVEQAYFDATFVPVPLDPARPDVIGGSLSTLFETTQQVASRGLQAERERLLHQLEVERARLAEVFRRAPSFLAVLRGPDHVFELVNDAYYQLVGNRAIIGKPALEAIPEARHQGFADLLDQVLVTGQPYVGRELPVALARSPGGPPELRFLDFVYQPIAEADGTRSGVIAHGHDVTEEVQARQEVERLLRASEDARRALDEANAALRASEARLRDVLEQAPIAVAVMTGPEHVYTIVSPRYAEYGGGRTMLGRTVREALPELATQGVIPILDRVYQSGMPFFAAERVIHLDRNGDGVTEPYIFNVGYQPLRDESGKVYAIASVAIDMTAQVRARRELEMAREAAEAARAEAERANRVKADFLGTMSHELRTPLNAIGGYAELLELGVHGPITPAQAQALARIQASQRHLLGLINEVLNYTRVEAGVVRYELEAVPVAATLIACEALTAPQMRARGVTYHAEPCPPDLMVRADREKVQQIVLNLLSNAIKFTDRGGSIAVRCERRGDWVAMQVSDTGLGVPAERLESIFEPFVQVDAGLTRTQEGVGLGLAISRDLARGMGGELSAESMLGAGSVFTLTLPGA